MKIINIAKNAINSFATKASTVARTNMHMSVPQSTKLAGLSKDVFEKAQNFDFSKIRLGNRINSGREANVFEILGTEDYVIRIKKSLDFSPKLLKEVFPTDKIDDITVASNADKSIKVLRKITGKPLYGKDWDIFKTPDVKEYLTHFSELEQLPDKVFVDYLRQINELRKKGFDIDKLNPNNYLYDATKQKINIVDVSKKTSINNALTLDELSPLVDGQRIERFFRQLGEEEKQDFIKRLQTLINRIVSAAKQEDINVEIEAINKKRLQTALTYLYHNDKKMVSLM